MFNIGDKVLCINDNFRLRWDCEYPKICHIYTARSFVREGNRIGVRLKGMKCPIIRNNIEGAWNIKNFCKIDYNKGLLKSKEKTCNKNKINV